MVNDQTHHDGVRGLDPWTLSLRDEMASNTMRQRKRLFAADAVLDVRQGIDSLWLFVQREGAGGFACRLAYSPGRPIRVRASKSSDDNALFHVSTVLGKFHVQIETFSAQSPLVHWTTTFLPAEDVQIPYWPRDLYPLDTQGDPMMAEGIVHASQRGLNTGLVYLTLQTPPFGSALYFQNFTALNDYFQATETTPDGCVGGHWPELGYQPPPGEKPLPHGKAVVLSDAYLHWNAETPQPPRQSAHLFLDLLAGIYRHLDRPESEYHDWSGQAKRTLHDLARSPSASVRAYGNRYLHPYTAAEYPDSMVQLTVLLPLCEYQSWRERAIPLVHQLRAGVPRFFDSKLATIRRYLPNVGKDKNADEVDSWYLYHPLANLARLANEGDTEARKIFLSALDYGIHVAQHFKYVWPVQFNIQTLDVITARRQPNAPGQSDTGGLYAYVMLQAYDLTGSERYLGEAKQAIHALSGYAFNLEYQANITAYGANACLRLWKITGDMFYREQSYVFLACLFHNSLIWTSRIGNAEHYPTFLGVTCLHDGPYMALYECFETFASFQDYLKEADTDVPDSVQMLLTEYCKYALTRAWYYYPGELPESAVATEIRNGSIGRHLAFPLEDLYADGQPAGQVGQEIYGCGAAFAFTTRSYHRLARAPFLIYAEYPLFDLEETDEPCVGFRLRGLEGYSCRIRLIASGPKTLPPVTVRIEGSTEIGGVRTPEGHLEFRAPGSSRIEIRWQRKK